MANKPILCLDFDGVIHRYSKGWQDGSIYDPPTDGFFEWLIRAQDHFMVVIYSSRSKDGSELAKMSAWMSKHAMEWRAKHETPLQLNVSFAHKKPAAFLTIDDRALTFSGDWSDYDPTALLHFKPWNQKKAIVPEPEFDRVIHKQPPYKPPPKEMGFTGDLCVQCGGASMVRNGPCLLCMSCGHTTGCS